MTITYQLALTLPGTEARGQLDIFTALPAYVDGEPAQWSKPARDLTTWQGMAEELAERLPDFDALTLAAQGMVVGAFLAELEATPGPLGATPERIAFELDAAEGRRGRDRTRGTEGLARFLALECVGMMAAWGVEA